MRDWKEWHGEVISAFLQHLNQESNQFVLKGGTALMECYHLDRFSEDIDLDGLDSEIEKHIASFCEDEGISYRVAKDTDTVKRYMIHYGNIGRPLKVEVSYRKKEIKPEEINRIHGILVYDIEALCVMKMTAYNSRDRIRDLYDITFIYNNYKEELSATLISSLQASLEYKGIEYFDYVVKQQADELIDDAKLAEDFLTMYDDLGLLYDEEEDALIAEYCESQADSSEQYDEKANNLKHVIDDELEL